LFKYGAAIEITNGGSVTMQDVHFKDNGNTSGSGRYTDGGAIYIGSTSTATIERCIFSGNKSPNNNSSNGSCIYTEGNMTLTNSLFYDNTCGYGSSTSYTGHIFTRTETAGASTSIINCTFTENNAGTVVNYYDGASGTHTQKNNLFYNNSSSYDVNEGNCNSTYPEMDNCYYEARSGSYNTGSETGNLTSGTVGFTDASNDDFSLSSSSACVDAGTDSGAPSGDLDGQTRSSTDIGCYEYVLPQWTGGAGTTDWNTAGNWARGSVPGSSVDGIIISAELPGTDPLAQFPAVFQSVVPAPPVHCGRTYS
jgi:hypothetical protein